ncbi:DNA polymerase [Cyphomyrmex costatus]|uniref:DNA-directed DNA polymerase n=1 Tax=Cyphomyrmex costatus TaxID=456900 RepID=A0A151I933_9HYME|nr:DNA polymerase [Cyphomyrmex costatus]
MLTGAVVNSNYIEPRHFLNDARDIVIPQIRSNLQKHACLKVNTIFNGEFVVANKRSMKSIATKNHVLYGISDLKKWYDKYVMDVILTDLEEFQERESGWALSRILNLIVNVNKFYPMHCGCFVNLPRRIILKRATVNVQSFDNACFAWSIVAALYPASNHVSRTSQYPHYLEVLRFEDITFPVTLKQITKFEHLNDISVNVKKSTVADTMIVPLRVTKIKRNIHVNLLYVQDQQHDDNGVGHFVLIKDLSRLLSFQLRGNASKKYICDRCLHYFKTRDKLSSHDVDCARMNKCTVLLPNENDKWLSFRNYNRKKRLPFVVYADLECILEKTGIDDDHISRFNYQHHKVFSIGYYVRCDFDETMSMYASFRGENCVEWFVGELYKLTHRVKSVYVKNLRMNQFTTKQWQEFVDATHCHICEKPFEIEHLRVRDHCHITGRYRGPAHSDCNINYRDSCVIPVFFHNLSGYDAHFIIKDIANKYEGTVHLLPVTKENYISFTKYVKDTVNGSWKGTNMIQLRFVDSFKFLSSSLEKLVSYLDKSKLNITRSIFFNLDEQEFAFLTRKGVFPYEYVNSFDKLNETSLPPREAFYSSLTGEDISVDDYQHATDVWQRFRINTLGDYSDLYLKTDVLLLADVFENFRDTCMESYGLDPAYYVTLPSYTWDAMLKNTGVRFELLTDIDMVLFIERGIRGGLSQCSHRYARANNVYVPTFDPSKPISYLMYFDVNNLYGWAMMEPLPYGEFHWIDNVDGFDVMSVPVDSDVGYILEVDLTYPHVLHDSHYDLPFCPTKELPPGGKYEKLLATLNAKERYVIHYRNLQQCIRHGLVVTKIHRILQFAQSRWLRGYIEVNTRFRMISNNDFERNLYKLMNNAVFGKTMENVRDYKDVRLVTVWDGRYGLEAMIAKPNFCSRSIFSENLVAVELRKLEVTMNKPIYVGMCILEISKIRLYDFHYEHMVPLYRDKCTLMYTDTDSLIYFLKCFNAYEDVKRNITKFDTSDYPEDNVYGIPRLNNKIPCLMKDENNVAVMTEFIGLRAKMYVLRVVGMSDVKKIKGIRKNVVAKTISFEDYVKCLHEAYEQSRRQSRIRSSLHEVFTIFETKIALSPYDNKRYVLPNAIGTLPWGHYKIPNFADVQ